MAGIFREININKFINENFNFSNLNLNSKENFHNEFGINSNLNEKLLMRNEEAEISFINLKNKYLNMKEVNIIFTILGK